MKSRSGPESTPPRKPSGCRVGRRLEGRPGHCASWLLAIWFCLAATVAPARGDELDELDVPPQSPPSAVRDLAVLSGGLAWGPRFDITSGLTAERTGTGSCCEVRAGDLWKYFHDQGYSSLDSLILCVDVPVRSASGAQFRLEGLEMSIKGDGDRGETVWLGAIGAGEGVVMRGLPSRGGRAEAAVEIPLGFDFMDRFTADSSERLLVNVSYAGQPTEMPSLSIAARRSLFTSPSLVILCAFVVFWAVVFWILRRLAPPRADQQDGPAAHVGISRNSKTRDVVTAA